MNEVILFIDTSDNKKVEVSLSVAGEKYTKVVEVGKESAQAVLPLIEELLKEKNLSLQQLTGIQVNKGPGSFTGLRVGASIANTLSSILRIPVNRKEIGEIIDPQYK